MAEALGPAGVLGVAWALLPALFGFVLLANIDALSAWLRSNVWLGLAGYICVFVVASGLGVLPTYAQAVLGGWVFGTALGLPAALAGFVGGSLIGLIVARFVAQDRLMNLIAGNAKARAVHRALVGSGTQRSMGVVALLRLPPNSPFALTNLVMATTGVPLISYIVGTAVGMAPRTALAVVLADRAAAATQSRSIKEFIENGPGLPVLIGGIAAAVLVLAIIGHIANSAIMKLSSASGSEPVLGRDGEDS